MQERERRHVDENLTSNLDLRNPEWTEKRGATSNTTAGQQIRKQHSEPRLKIYPQSSADTSGLGDSLQRIHVQSSTETSGFGDSINSPTLGPSPEGPIYVGSSTSETYPGFKGHYTNASEARSLGSKRPLEAGDRGGRKKGNIRSNSTEVHHCNPDINVGRIISNDELPTFRGKFDHHYSPAFDISANSSKHRRTVQRELADSLGAAALMDMDMHRMSQSLDHEGSLDGDYYDDFQEYDDRNNNVSRSSSNQSIPYPQGFFLGRTTQSTWLSWSKDRRASFKRRLAILEKKQKEAVENRVPTPVLKARKESVAFCPSAGLLPMDQETDEIRERLQSYVPSPKYRMSLNKEDVKLSVHQWNTLRMFWEHAVFMFSRCTGLLLSFFALTLTIVSLTNSNWSLFLDHPDYGTCEAGLWFICSKNFTVEDHSNCTFRPVWPDSQNAVIGLFIFAALFGFFASLLAIAGLCSTTLAKKIYYFHSGGEIFVISALALVAALVLYAVCMENYRQSEGHAYGVGYAVGWGSAFLYMAGALCMCVDDFVRSLAKRRRCCYGSEGDYM